MGSLLKQIDEIRKTYSDRDERSTRILQLVQKFRNKGYPEVLLKSIEVQYSQTLINNLLVTDGGNPALTEQSAPDHVRGAVPLSITEINEVEAEFDADYYLRKYPDIDPNVIDPYVHYINYGWKEGRNPRADFNVESYLENNPDVRRSGIEPFTHYINRGRKEKRRVQKRMMSAFRLPSDIDAKEHCILLPTKNNNPHYVTKKLDKTLGVHIHVHYYDEIDWLFNKLRVLPFDISYYFSCTSDEAATAVQKKCKSIGLAPVSTKIVPNRGRDIAPLLLDFAQALKQHHYCLHLHIKNSVEKKEELGKAWFSHMLQCVLFDEQYVTHILSVMDELHSCQILVPAVFEPIREQMTWGKNKAVVEQLINKLGLSADILSSRCPYFPAGSFFWFKTSLLDKFDVAKLTLADFPEEPIPDDGTIAHALERTFGIIESQGQGYVLHIRPLDFHVNICPSVNPLISIVIPAHNAEPWLYDALSSCLNQDFQHGFEVIIVENGSTDKTHQIAQAYSKAYPNIVRVLQNSIPGAGHARNRGLSLARGEFVTFMDADDVLPPWSLQVLWDGINIEPNIDASLGSLRFFHELGYGRAIPFGNSAEAIVIDVESNSSKKLTESPTWSAIISDFGPCAKLYRKSFLFGHGLEFPEGNYEDNFFISHVYALAKRISVCKNTVYLYRKLDSRKGTTQSTRLLDRDLTAQLNVFFSTFDSLREHTKEGAADNNVVRSILKSFGRKCSNMIRQYSIDKRGTPQHNIDSELYGAVTRFHKLADKIECLG